MSLANVERFSRVSAAAAGLLSDEAPASLEAAVDIAAACGYGFTVEEARAFIHSQAVNPDKELSDEQLEKVTGGVGMGEPD
jgi:bacteriocin-like protein